jgi:uncharacterized protein (TIGR02147 family)
MMNPTPEIPHNEQIPRPRLVLSAYTDFRKYLKDYYLMKVAETKGSLRPYGYAQFSVAADIKSPAYLKLIIEGRRNLSPSMILKFAKALEFSKDETEEFRLLVLFGQAQDPLERNRHLKDLAELRVNHQLRTGELPSDIWDKVPGWVAWVLYAMADQKDVEFQPHVLRALMRNKPSLDEVKKSLSRLLESGELQRDPETHEVVKARELMAGVENVPVALVRKLQAELIYLGLESLFQDSPLDREFGALTFALTEEEFEHLKFELRHLRKRLFKDFAVNRKSVKGDRVFQLNIQLFPVTKRFIKT